MSNNPCKHEGKRVLLVEGGDDCHVILSLCNTYNVPETFGIYDCGSDQNVLKRLNALILQPEPLDVIGVVLDADNPDINGRWTNIQRKLRNYSYQFPNQPVKEGTILEGSEGLPKLGFWLMPNNLETGILEDFCCEMIDVEAKDYIVNRITEAQTNQIATFKSQHRSKAIVHTYLAWQDEPGQPMGRAITCQVLRCENEVTYAFINWLNGLFC